MIASNKKYGLSYDDYIIGALLLYSVKYIKVYNSIIIGCDNIIFMGISITRNK